MTKFDLNWVVFNENSFIFEFLFKNDVVLLVDNQDHDNKKGTHKDANTDID